MTPWSRSISSRTRPSEPSMACTPIGVASTPWCRCRCNLGRTPAKVAVDTPAQAKGRVPALVAGVVQDATLVHVTGAGGVPDDPRDLQFRIGSISKTLTAAVVLGLRDEGRLALDDPLDRHVAGTGVGQVTIRQLLGHASGLQREPEGDWWERSAGPSAPQL